MQFGQSFNTARNIIIPSDSPWKDGDPRYSNYEKGRKVLDHQMINAIQSFVIDIELAIKCEINLWDQGGGDSLKLLVYLR